MRVEDVQRRERVLALLQKYGWNATGFQVLEPSFEYWFDGDDACVAYVRAGRAWVVAGAPVAPADRIAEVATRFAEHARRGGHRAVFFAVEQRFLDAIPLPALQIGEQPFWDPQAWASRHVGHRKFKEQLRRARAKGVVVERVDPHAVRPELEMLIGRWVASRPMPPMAFLVELAPFVFAEHRRYYLARTHGEVCGALVAVPVYSRNGWFFEDVIRDPSAPNGAAEALVDFAMREVAADGADFVTLGLAPLSGDAPWLARARRLFASFYNFEGLRTFKAKFRPDAWDPIFVAAPSPRGRVLPIHDVLSAFAKGHPLRFAGAALLRAPAIVLYALAALLIPWIAILAAADTERWFPAFWVKAAWIAFDLVIAGTLFALAKRWRTGVARAAFVAVMLDCTLTTVQALTFNARHATGLWTWLVIAVSVAAPAFAARVLWGGLRRHALGVA